ncbi:hypothetical protein FKM82_028231 [Ascaphus truei]
MWGNRRGQLAPSAMSKPRPGRATCRIVAVYCTPLPGKYELEWRWGATSPVPGQVSPLWREQPGHWCSGSSQQRQAPQ